MLLVVLLTGCLSPRIDVTIDPDTIKVTSEMTAIEGVSLKFKMRGGISFSYTLKEVLVTLKDEDGGEERITPKTVDLENKKIPVFFRCQSCYSHRSHFARRNRGNWCRLV